MAVIDPRNDTVVIRVVYDGAPMAGKSTSVGALGRGLGSSVYSPAEVSGRTLFFDWLDYTGGRFDDRRIRCQILSVPGQATLAPRRRRLLESADAIVFVADSSPAGFISDRGYLSGLARVLDQIQDAPIGLVVQANKRDLPDAVPLAQIRSILGTMELRVGIVESVAKDGVGIREAFVVAVRLALDRVRLLMLNRKLMQARPDADSPRELLDLMKQREEGSLEYAAESGLIHTRVSEVHPQSIVSEALAVASAESHVPATPDERVESGLIWPPVDGRAVLRELAQAAVRLTRSGQGDWVGVVPGRWQLRSADADVFDDINRGRAVLVDAARIHAAGKREGSIDKCVVLASDGQGRWRLWQITAPASPGDDG
jgi:signal recognition particle receptor subunit beta